MSNSVLIGLLASPFMLTLYLIALVVLIILYFTGYFKKKSGFTTFVELTDTNDRASLYIMNTNRDVENFYLLNTNGDSLTANVTNSQTETNIATLNLSSEEGGADVGEDDIAETNMSAMPSVLDPNITILLNANGTYPLDLVALIDTRLKSLTKLFRYMAIRMMIIQAQEKIPKEDMDEADAYYAMARTILLGHLNNNVESRSDTVFVVGEEVQEVANGAVSTVKTAPTSANPNVILSNNKSVAPSALRKRFPIVEAFGLWTNRIFYKGRWYRFDVKALKPYENLPINVSENAFKCSSLVTNCSRENLRMCDVLSYALPTQLFDMNAISEDPALAIDGTQTYQKCDSNTLYAWYVLIYNYIGTIRDDFYNQKYRDYTRTLGGTGTKSYAVVSTTTKWENGRSVTKTRTRWVDPGARCYHKDVLKKPGLKDPITYVPKYDISYDRGVGKIPANMTVPKGCSGDKKKIDAFCYHPNVKRSELMYIRGSKWRKGKIRYNPPRKGYSCRGAVCSAIPSNPDDCPEGYRSTGPQTCERINKCPDGEEFNAGLCYKKCRDGYKGAATICSADKPTLNCRLRPDAYRLKDLMCVPRVLNKDRRGKQIYECPRKRDYRSQIQTYNKDLSVPYPETPYAQPEPPSDASINMSDVPASDLPPTDMSSNDYMAMMGMTDAPPPPSDPFADPFATAEPGVNTSDPFANDAWSSFTNKSGFSAKLAQKFA